MKTTVKWRGSHTPRKAGTDVAALLAQFDITVTETGHGRRRLDDAEAPTEQFPALVDAHDDQAGPAFDDAMTLQQLALKVALLGAEVATVAGREPNGNCEHCQLDGYPAEITIYSSAPVPGAERDMDEACRNCTHDLVAKLRTRFGLDVLVEIPAVTA